MGKRRKKRRLAKQQRGEASAFPGSVPKNRHRSKEDYRKVGFQLFVDKEFYSPFKPSEGFWGPYEQLGFEYKGDIIHRSKIPDENFLDYVKNGLIKPVNDEEWEIFENRDDDRGKNVMEMTYTDNKGRERERVFTKKTLAA